MNIKELASQIALLEGKKKQTHISDIREILALIVKLQVEAELAFTDGPVDVLLDRVVVLLEKASAKKRAADKRKATQGKPKTKPTKTKPTKTK